jgi:hypothetical protein
MHLPAAEQKCCLQKQGKINEQIMYSIRDYSYWRQCKMAENHLFVQLGKKYYSHQGKQEPGWLLKLST